jgi:UDP-glucose:(heptosyl)LPS alpha-1,3-glucosyltransferase
VSLLASSFENVPWETRQIKIEGRGFGRAHGYNRFLHNLEQHLLGTGYDVVHAMLPVNWCDLYHPHAGLAVEQITSGHLKYKGSFAQSMAKLGNRLNARRQKFAKVERQLLGRPDPPLVICLSEYVKRSVQQHYYGLKPQDLVTLFNAVNLRKFDPAARPQARAEMRKELGIEDNQVMALMIAQDFYRKGLREAIGAMVKVPTDKLVLVVVGDDRIGPYHKLADTLSVASRVIYAGSTDDPYPYYRAADFFLLPTKHDPCSLATLEALAMGLPVISTRMNGATEIMTDGIDGFILADPMRLDMIAKAIQQLIDKRKREAMSEACLTHRSKLSFDNHLAELLKIYQQAISRRLRGAPGK